ncbi:hypothetical protein [Mycolicibacterium palauense]|uniref:hypothetical protein n=1 Tax=Mycolicibacterium palauense TaxID=2034511 RepID=UPI001FEB139C|nr:hypothetical protein [Mycolicibacterium palauense]
MDFREIPNYPDDAAWLLEWESDELEAPVLGGMRLLVNSSHETLPEMLRSGSSDARSGLLRAFVTFDVARSLVVGALASEHFVEDPESFESGTIGRMLFELISTCWPGAQLSALQARSIDDAARFEAELQARFGVIG